MLQTLGAGTHKLLGPIQAKVWVDQDMLSLDSFCDRYYGTLRNRRKWNQIINSRLDNVCKHSQYLLGEIYMCLQPVNINEQDEK